MNEKIICAGFGGQGVMLMGQLLAYAGMIEGRQVSWLPSYGPEMRGGTANCQVMIANEPIASPVITNDATGAIIMNLPSLIKFESSVIKQGIIVVNSSMVSQKISRRNVNVCYIPANEIAIEIGNNKVANMVLLGAYLKLSAIVKPKTVINALKKKFGKQKAHLIEINELALAKGGETVCALNVATNAIKKKASQAASLLGCKI